MFDKKSMNTKNTFIYLLDSIHASVEIMLAQPLTCRKKQL